MKTDRECYYFRHYADSRQDPKIVRLLMAHGMEGYGIFWAILEMLRTAKEYTIDYDPDTIAFQLNNNCTTIRSVCESFNLFKIDSNKIHSPSFTKFLTERSEKYRKNVSQRRDRLQLYNNCTTTDLQSPYIKGKESKGKESKFINPSINEVREYISSKGYSFDPAYFWNYYEARGWMFGKNKIKSWKACARTWALRNQDDKPATVIIDPNHNAKMLQKHKDMGLI